MVMRIADFGAGRWPFIVRMPWQLQGRREIEALRFEAN